MRRCAECMSMGLFYSYLQLSSHPNITSKVIDSKGLRMAIQLGYFVLICLCCFDFEKKGKMVNVMLDGFSLARVLMYLHSKSTFLNKY